MKPTSGTLVLTWGNPGRRDDGLGPALAVALEQAHLPGVTVETDYQLQIECAADVARHERVIFVDADRTAEAPFGVRRLLPGDGRPRFSTHSVAPETVLALSRDLFSAEPEAWLLGIRGYEFDDFGQALSAGAEENLHCAVEFVTSVCRSEEPEAAAPFRKRMRDPGTNEWKGEPCKTAST